MNDIEASDPRLGSLMILQVNIVSPTQSTTQSKATSWTEMSLDLRSGDLLLIKSDQLGLRLGELVLDDII